MQTVGLHRWWILRMIINHLDNQTATPAVTRSSVQPLPLISFDWRWHLFEIIFNCAHSREKQMTIFSLLIRCLAGLERQSISRIHLQSSLSKWKHRRMILAKPVRGLLSLWNGWIDFVAVWPWSCFICSLDHMTKLKDCRTYFRSFEF